MFQSPDPEELTSKKSEKILSSNSERHKLSNHLDDLHLPIANRKGSKTCTKHQLSKFLSYSSLSPSYYNFVFKLSTTTILQGRTEVSADRKWKKAMIKRYECFKNRTFRISFTHMENGCRIWVFSIKYKDDSSVKRNKVRLLDGGFIQTYGVDYGNICTRG